MKKNIIIVFIYFIFLISINCQDEYDKLFDDINNNVQKEDAVNNEVEIPKFKFSVFGDNKFKFLIPVTKDHLDFYGYIKAPRFENEIGLRLSYKTLTIISDWQLDLRLNEFGNIDDVIQVKPLENSIKWTPWKFNIKAGFQYFNWGVADKINPTDNLNPKDYRLGFDSEKLSLLSLYVGFFPADFISIETVYAPFEQSDKFPKNFEKEIPEEFFYGQSLNIASLPTLDFDLVKNSKNTESENLKFNPASFLIGGKINFYFRYVDFSFSYLYDVDPYYTPVIELKKDRIENTPFGPVPSLYIYRIDNLALKRNRLHRIGGDVKINLDRYGLWLETCYTITEDYAMDNYKIRNHNLSWVLGFDFNYGPGNDFYFNIQYVGEYNPLFDDRFYKDYVDGYPDNDKINNKSYMEEYYYRAIVNNLGVTRYGFIQGLVLNLKWPVLNSLLTPSIKTAYLIPFIYDYDREIKYGSLYINPELDLMPIDSFHIKIGASLYYSWHKIKGENPDIDYEDKIGMFYFHNNIYIAINYKWDFEWSK